MRVPREDKLRAQKNNFLARLYVTPKERPESTQLDRLTFARY